VVGCLNSGMAHLGSHLADSFIQRRCNREYQGEADDLKSHSGADYLENTQRTSEEKTQFSFGSVDAVAQCQRLKGGTWLDVGCALVAFWVIAWICKTRQPPDQRIHRFRKAECLGPV
jgi:hypothetical protein